MARCGRKTEVFSRVCGYYRPVKNWNRGKEEEFKERKVFKPSPSARRSALSLLVLIGLIFCGCTTGIKHKSDTDSGLSFGVNTGLVNLKYDMKRRARYEKEAGVPPGGAAGGEK